MEECLKIDESRGGVGPEIQMCTTRVYSDITTKKYAAVGVERGPSVFARGLCEVVLHVDYVQ